MARLPDGSFYRVISFVNGRLWLQYYSGSSLIRAEKRFAQRINLLKNHLNVRMQLRYVRIDHSYQVVDCWRQDLREDYQRDVKNTIAHIDKTHRKLNGIGIYASGHYTVSALECHAMNEQLDWLFKQREMGLIQLCDDERGCIYWHGHNCKCWFDGNGHALKKVHYPVASNETPEVK